MAKNEQAPFGETIRRLRDEKDLSQQELGELVGYGASGAGISILRVEKQGVIPRTTRIDAFAQVLGVDPAVLRSSADRAREVEGIDPLATRLQSLKRQHGRREALEGSVQGLVAARENADQLFLLPFRTASELVSDLPDETEIALTRTAEFTSGNATEATYRLGLTKAGLARALSEHSKSGSAGEDLAGAVAKGAAAAAWALPAAAGSTALLNGLSAVLRAGQPMAKALGGASGLVGLTAAMGIGAVVSSFAGRSKRQREDVVPILENAESEVAESARNIEVLEELVPCATKLFEDISLYGSRALGRWVTNVGDVGVCWAELKPLQQDTFLALIDVASAHLAAATISFQDLAGLRGEDLTVAQEIASQVLLDANEIVSARV